MASAGTVERPTARAERDASSPARPRAVLLLACWAHFVHDGFADILYVLLPIWAREFDSGVRPGRRDPQPCTPAAMSLFQIPAGLLAERWGERRLLAAGDRRHRGRLHRGGVDGRLRALSWLVLLVAGLGSGVQHPLSSTLVSAAYETGRRRAALGTYNFSGDLGKIAMPPRSDSPPRSSAGARPPRRPGCSGSCAAAAIFLVLLHLGDGRAASRRRHAAGRAAGASATGAPSPRSPPSA